MGLGQDGGDAVIFLGWSRKMKDDVRLIFSLIRQQTEMEGGEQEVGGWALHCRNQQGLMEKGTDSGKLRPPALWGERC